MEESLRPTFPDSRRPKISPDSRPLIDPKPRSYLPCPDPLREGSGQGWGISFTFTIFGGLRALPPALVPPAPDSFRGHRRGRGRSRVRKDKAETPHPPRRSQSAPVLPGRARSQWPAGAASPSLSRPLRPAGPRAWRAQRWRWGQGDPWWVPGPEGGLRARSGRGKGTDGRRRRCGDGGQGGLDWHGPRDRPGERGIATVIAPHPREHPLALVRHPRALPRGGHGGRGGGRRRGPTARVWARAPRAGNRPVHAGASGPDPASPSPGSPHGPRRQASRQSRGGGSRTRRCPWCHFNHPYRRTSAVRGRAGPGATRRGRLRCPEPPSPPQAGSAGRGGPGALKWTNGAPGCFSTGRR